MTAPDFDLIVAFAWWEALFIARGMRMYHNAENCQRRPKAGYGAKAIAYCVNGTPEHAALLKRYFSGRRPAAPPRQVVVLEHHP